MCSSDLADVTKNERRGDGGPGGGGGGNSGGGFARPASNQPPAYDYDEEPF